MASYNPYNLSNSSKNLFSGTGMSASMGGSQKSTGDATSWGGVADWSQPFSGKSNAAAAINSAAGAVADATGGATSGATGGTTVETPTPTLAETLAGTISTSYGNINLSPEQQTYATTLTSPNQGLFEDAAGWIQQYYGAPGANPSAQPNISSFIMARGSGNNLDFDYITNPYTTAHTQFLTTPEGQTWQTQQQQQAEAKSEATALAQAQAQANAEAQVQQQTHIASQRRNAYDAMTQSPSGSLYSSILGSGYNSNIDYNSLFDSKTSVPNAADLSTLQNAITTYGQGSAFQANPELRQQLAQTIADPERRSSLVEALNYFNDNPMFRPASETRYGSGFSSEQVRNENASSSFATMIGSSDFGLAEGKAQQALWDQTDNIIPQNIPAGWDRTWLRRAKYSQLGGTGPITDYSVNNSGMGTSGSNYWDAVSRMAAHYS